MTVTFYGDFLLESNPATFDAAVKTFMDLPKMLIGADGKGQMNSVPVKVWQQPLELFTIGQPGPVIRSISVGLVLEAVETLEDLSIKLWCKDSLSSFGEVPSASALGRLQRHVLPFD